MSTIKWSPVTSQLVDQSPGTVVVGAPGSGKTFALLNFAANCLGMGQRVVAIDPKNDFDKLLNVNPNIKIINIKKIKPGALNPFEFLKKYDPDTNQVKYLDTSTLLTIIELLCGKLDKQTNVAITPIISDFVTRAKMKNEYVDLQDVADYLFANQNEYAQNVGTILKMYEDNEFGPLLFTREEHVEPLVLSPTDSMIFILHGLNLPDYTKKPEDYDANERFTSTIVYIITSKLLDILTSDTKIPTTLICDEAHLLFGNKEMSAVIDKFLVLGRSLNIATILASQGISHFSDGIANYITTKFMFKSSMEESKLFLEKFNSANLNASTAIDTNSIIAAAAEFPKGVCFMMDRNGRNGIIKIKSIYDISLLTSNPIEKIRQNAEDAVDKMQN